MKTSRSTFALYACLTFALVCDQLRAVETPSAAEIVKLAERSPEENPFRQIAAIPLEARTIVHAIISKNGKRVLISGGNELATYDVESGKKIAVREPFGNVSPNSQFLAINKDGSLAALVIGKRWFVFSGETGKPVFDGSVSDIPCGMSFTEDGRAFVVVVPNGTIDRVNLANGKVAKFPLLEDDDQTAKMQLAKGIAISPDGRRVVALPNEEGTQIPMLHWSNERHCLSFLPTDPSRKMIQRTISAHYLTSTSSDGKMRTNCPIDDGNKKLTLRGQSVISLKGDIRGVANGIDISSDQRYTFRITSGEAEIYPLGGIGGIATVHAIDQDIERITSLTADKFRFVAIDESNVRIYGLSKPLVHPSGDFGHTIVQLLMDEKFETLDAVGELLTDDAGFFPWVPAQTKYNMLIDAIRFIPRHDILPGPRKERVEKWVEKHPKSRLARLVQAKMLIDEGWEARGAGFAGTVTPDGGRVFATKIREAGEILEGLSSDDKMPLDAYDSIFAVAKAEGWEKERRETHLAALLKRNPRYFSSYREMVMLLLPRWGGEPAELGEFASRVGDAIGGPDGDVAYARIALHLTHFEQEAFIFGPAGLDYDRVQRGCDQLQKITPNGNFGDWASAVFAFSHSDDDRLRKAIARIEKRPLNIEEGIFWDGQTARLMLLHFGGVDNKGQRPWQ